MKRVHFFAVTFLSAMTLVPVAAQQATKDKKFAPPDKKFAPPKANEPDEVALKAIKEKTSELGQAISLLRAQGVRDPWLADVEIFHNAAINIVQHKEFFNKDSAKWTLEVLDKGLLRARFLATGQTPWFPAVGHTIVRGYRSRIDGTAQPYAISFPPNFTKEIKKWRTDVVLHGRNSTLTEASFLRGFADKAVEPRHYVQIDIFGRGNNAYRWAGETDVFEVIGHHFGSVRGLDAEKLLDPGRVVLRGFSMGGAGTWHLGLHFPDRWCVIGPGAGFTTTHGYVAGLPNPLPPHQEACLKIYDAIDYTENAFGVPIVAYSGALDAQKKAADVIEARVKSLGLHMEHLIAPDQEHRFPPEWQKKADALWSMHAQKGRPEYPTEIRFTTYTVKYNEYRWLEIISLDKHYAKTDVHARRKKDGFDLTTRNVRGLHLTLESGTDTEQAIEIDGQKLTARPWVHDNGTQHLYLVKRKGTWQTILPQRLIGDLQRHPQKIKGLQGPIDDAFTDAFLCVRGTGKPWHQATQTYADENLARFRAEWSKYLRGQLPIKNDNEVTNEDIATKHLILFGDPASNSLLAQVADALPLSWNSKEIRFAGKVVSASDHVPVLIQPNPLNASRYVVVNSGHTFHAKEFQSTNAQLYPRLGDYALLRLAPTTNDPLNTDVVLAGLCDEFWRIME